MGTFGAQGDKGPEQRLEDVCTTETTQSDCAHPVHTWPSLHYSEGELSHGHP